MDEFHDPRAVNVAGDHGDVRHLLAVVTDAQGEPDDALLGRIRAELCEELLPLVEAHDGHAGLLLKQAWVVKELRKELSSA